MTEALKQAATPNAAFGPVGNRHGRRSEQAAGAFDEALGTPKTQAARIDAGLSAKLRGNGHPWRHGEVRTDTATTALDGSTHQRADLTLDEGADIRRLADMTAADDADTEAQPDSDDSIDERLPTQIKAEQAISAIMTIARQTNPAARKEPEATSGARADEIVQGTVSSDKLPEARHAAGARPSAQGAPASLQRADAKVGPARSEVVRDPTAEPAVQSSRPAAESAPPIRSALAQPTIAAASAQSAATASRQQQTAVAPDREETPATSSKAEASRNSSPQARLAEATPPFVERVAGPVPATPQAGGAGGGAEARQDIPAMPEAAREARHGELLPASARMSVIAEQAAPAPAAPSLSANAAAIVSAISGEQDWRTAQHLSPADLARSANNARPMRSLKIQLHPAELGMVTAQLRTVGEQLSVELRVDSHEAYHRLTADSDAIVKSLRSLGFDIDKVSIQQPQAAATTVARSEGGAGTGSFSRDTPSFQPGNSGNGGEQSGGQAGGRGQGSGGQGNETAQPISQNRSGSSLYI